jgi:hypothetical protein
MNSTAGSGTDKDLFRHALAALAYRAGKAVRGAPESFGEFRGAVGLRTPCEILAHMGDLDCAGPPGLAGFDAPGVGEGSGEIFRHLAKLR